jgi:peptidoglycan/xylan/chitin deacetylase (PgdA/CDA1 family)
MQPDDYGPFPYVPINRRPKWKWPNGARVALWVAPNLEFFPLKAPLAGQPWQKASEQKAPTVRAWGQRDYGNRIGIFRIMEVLSKYGIRATASLNADLCDHHPQIVEDAVKLGWEFMGHNRTNATWLNAVPPEEEGELIRYCTERLRQATGRRPAGWLSSGIVETWNTLDHLTAEGYLYVTDWVNDDQPYRMSVNGKTIVYLPYSYEINDNAQILQRHASSDDFELMVKRTFDVLYREGQDSARVMAICLHPFLTGVPHRIGGLDSALKYICAHEDVWLATGEEIVRAYLASGAAI